MVAEVVPGTDAAGAGPPELTTASGQVTRDAQGSALGQALARAASEPAAAA